MARAQPEDDLAPLITAVTVISHAANGDFDVAELLTRLAEVAADHLAVDGAGVMRIDRGEVSFVHANAPEVEDVERLQAAHQQGPCWHAISTMTEVVIDDIGSDHDPDWQVYFDAARAAGLHAVLTVPLVSRRRCWGALDLYRRTPGPWSAHELSAARLLAELSASYLALSDDRDRARDVQKELAHLSTHDALTGLPNRMLLFDRLDHALAGAARHGRTVAVLFIDVDHFKQINDTFGHAAGDLVLVEIANRLHATLRQEDTLARLAGDEFVLFCEDLPQDSDTQLDAQVMSVADRVRGVLSHPMRVGRMDVVVSVSIGVALGDVGVAAEDLLGDADASMYRAKQRRRAAPVVREAATILSRRSVRALERQLAEALREQQLRVHYQPIVTAVGAELEAVEALVRWEHPEHGLLPAVEFIEIAENTGLIVPIGQWVIEQASAQMANWRVELGVRAPRTVYVNVSARELTDPALEQTLRTAVHRHGLDTHALGLELLEASFIHPSLVPSLLEHERRGHPLSVDDFGTGYSSLSRLVELPVRLAKIDQSFVSRITADRRRRAFVDAVITVANSLGLQVIAEGVETEEQARALADAGCHLLQGFHFGAPQTAEQLTAHYAA